MPPQDETPSGATPTDPTNLDPGTITVTIGKVPARDVFARTAAAEQALADLTARQAKINADVAAAQEAKSAADLATSTVVAGNPDGFLSKDADGRVVLLMKTSGGRGFNVTHPSSDEEMVDDPAAPVAGG